MTQVAGRILLLCLGGMPFLSSPVPILASLYGIALGTAMVGLWRRAVWGRKLFLALITVYYGLLLVSSVAFWGPLIGVPWSRPGQGWVTFTLAEACIGLGFGWWYLNRPTVKAWFDATARCQQDDRE